MQMNRNREIAAFVLALLGLKGVGPRTVADAIAQHRDSLLGDACLDLDYAASMGASKISRALEVPRFDWDEAMGGAWDVLNSAESIGASVLNPCDPAYPKRLLRNKKYPPILYCLGDLGAIDPEKSVAMVGTREPTSYGERMGRRLAELLSAEGYVVVSGLALGCDTVAHEGALGAGGKTVAVLPTPIGADVYPAQNQALADRILESGGALVSEYPPGMALGDRQLISNLVARDEWQPGLADGLIVFETSESGGTRHAMRHAVDTGTPLAVFDYSMKEWADFERNERFGGNAAYLRSGKATPISDSQSIERFKAEMERYRSASAGRCVQPAIAF